MSEYDYSYDTPCRFCGEGVFEGDAHDWCLWEQFNDVREDEND